MNLLDRMRFKLRGVVPEIDLPRSGVFEILERHEIDQWFYYIFRERMSRWDVWLPGLWIAENLPRDAVVFETGCGCGFNLLWLGQQGFTSLCGSDIQEKVVQAARDLSGLAGLEIDLWQDDALSPGRLPEQVDVLVANWTCFDERFSLAPFLSRYAPVLARRGIVVLDVIDRSYDDVPNNNYLTSDWARPVAERGPSEYKIRYAPGQVASLAAQAGFEIHKVLHRKQVIPRKVYLLRKR